ncbi:MAG: hypothetical protein EFT35_04420 [Methanophagales archaeon ANME-1-THS]|nr:MAG: hypothetical protein EFT35_04420 [Methanophagales archaeon ANME-1-THS]
MDKSKTVFFEPKIRVKMLEELVFPSIFRSSWEKEDKIRALYRHKLRVATCIASIEDADDREDLSTVLDALYAHYLDLIEVSPAEEEEGERAVKEEFQRIERAVHAETPAQMVSEAEVSPAVKWIRARIGMLSAQVAKNVYLDHPFTEEELEHFKKELNRVERKLASEPDSQVKAELSEEIEVLREHLVCF